MKRSPKKIGGLLSAALLINLVRLTAFGGDAAVLSKADTKTVVEPKANGNPLSFMNGMLTLDLQERVRWEDRENNFDFNNKLDSLTDDDWFLQRFRIGAMLKPTDWLKLYAQAQDSREYASDRPDYPGVLGAEGDDAFDLRQAYAEIGNLKQFPVTLKIGRQVLSYGDERLVGAFDWNNIGRTFDAAKFHIEQPNWWLDVFASTVVVPERGSYDQSDLFNGNETNRGQVFSGVYFSTSLVPVQTTDVYAFFLHENTSKNPAWPNNDTNFATFGTRIKGDPKKLAGFEYEFEGAFQTGEVRGMDLTAGAVHGGLGYNIDCWGKPRLFAEYNYATGDDNPTDGDINTFQNLFPTNHKFYGYMDLFSWQNMHNPAVSLRVTPAKNLTFQVDGHAFFLASNEDFWYRANGVTTVRPRSPEASTYAGSELDLTANWKPTKYASFLVGYSHFFAGDYLKASGRNDDADFGYAQLTLEL